MCLRIWVEILHLSKFKLGQFIKIHHHIRKLGRRKQREVGGAPHYKGAFFTGGGHMPQGSYAATPMLEKMIKLKYCNLICKKYLRCMSDQIIRTRIAAKENTDCMPFTYKSILYFTCLEILIFTKIRESCACCTAKIRICAKKEANKQN